MQSKPTSTSPSVHRRVMRVTDDSLGYERAICEECEVTWPCHEAVLESCVRNHLAVGLPCDCGWHEEKVAQDPEQEKGDLEKALRNVKEPAPEREFLTGLLPCCRCEGNAKDAI